MLRSLMAKIKTTMAYISQAYSANAESAVIDNQGAGSLMFVLNVGDFEFTGTNKITVVVHHSDLPSSDFAAVGAADLTSDAETPASGIYKILDDAADAEKIYNINYLGNKRYVKLVLTEGGTVSVPLSAIAVQGHLEQMPPA